MNTEQERADFEAWHAEHYAGGDWSLDRDPMDPDEYVDLRLVDGWEAWQARAAIEAERQAMRDPVEADTEDLIKRLLDAQQDINLAANEHMSQPLCDASALIDEIEQVLRRLSTRPQQIPEGWQLVPKEPTEEMMRSAYNIVESEGLVTTTWLRRTIYQAMLAAAPSPKDQS